LFNFKDRLFSPPRRLIGAAYIMDHSLAMVGLAVQWLGVYVLDAPNLVLGLFATFSAGGYTVGCLISGSLSDRYGRKRSVVSACLVVAGLWLLLPRLGSWRAVLAIMPFCGFAMAFYWPPLQAWLSELTPHNSRDLMRSLGLFNIMWCAGLMIGPVVTGYLWNVRWRATFSFPAWAVLLLILWLLPIPRTVRGPASEEENPASGTAPSRPDVDLFLWMARVGNFAAWFACGTILAMFPKLGHQLGMTPPVVGWLLFVYRLGQLAMFVYTRYEHRWQYRMWPLFVAQMAAAGGMAAVACTRSWFVFAFGFALAGMCAGMTYVGSLFYALHNRTADRGRASGLHEAILGSGILAGPLVGGALAQWLDLRAPFWAAALLLPVATGLQATLARRERNRKRSTGPVVQPCECDESSR